MTESVDHVALLGDARLSGDARTAGLLIYYAGEDGLAYTDLEQFLPGLSRDKMRRSVQLLERCDWVARVQGGRDHPDRFVHIASEKSTSYVDFRLAIFHNLKDRLPKTSKLSGHSFMKTSKLSPPSTTTPSSPPPTEEAREVEHGISPAAEKAIEQSAEKLNGCRDSLRDYLTRRVESEFQNGYVQRVVTSLDGADEWMWSDRSGRRLQEGRTKILAAALNELLSAKEVGDHLPDQPGSFGNLRSKVRYLVASTLGVERDAKRAGNGAPKAIGTESGRGTQHPRVFIEQ